MGRKERLEAAKDDSCLWSWKSLRMRLARNLQVVTIPEYVPQVDELVGIRSLILQLGSNAPALRSLMNKLLTKEGRDEKQARKGVSDALDVAIMKKLSRSGRSTHSCPKAE